MLWRQRLALGWKKPVKKVKSRHIRRPSSFYGDCLVHFKRLASHYHKVNTSYFKKLRKGLVKAQSRNLTNDFVAHLETRLDSLLFRSGLAMSSAQAAQWVSHRKALVNGHWTVRSRKLRLGDQVMIPHLKLEDDFNPEVNYVEWDQESRTLTLSKLPTLEDVPFKTVIDFSKVFNSLR